MRGIIAVQQAPIRRRRKITRWAVLAGLAIAGGALGWQHRRELINTCRSAKAFVLARIDEYLHGQPQSTPPAQAEPPSLVSAPPAAAPAPAPTSHADTPPPPIKPSQPGYWTVRGLVYDLYSLKPVSGARVTFVSRATGKRLLARTDSAGHYCLKAPQLSTRGYDVTVRHPRYQSNYLDENEPPYRQMGPERRQEAGNLFLQSEVLHMPFLPPPDEDHPWLNLVLMPR